MVAIVFDGRRWAEEKKVELKARVEALVKRGIRPKLVWIQAGDDEASELYGRLKGKAAAEIGILFEEYQIANIKNQKYISKIKNKIIKANSDPVVHGVMVQLPIKLGFRGKGLGSRDLVMILSLIDPRKDVDCLTPENLGLVMAGVPRFLPATVKAVREILELGIMNYELWKNAESKLETGNWKLKTFLRGKRMTVVGGGLEVGRPLVNMLSNDGATVLWARSAEQNLGQLTRIADIVISAVGKPGLITGEMVKIGAVVIDVGAPKGDVDFDSVKEKASFITPVPGGVGPVTVMCLMENVVVAAEVLFRNKKSFRGLRVKP
jgi:methylenetetrahydrofolate dehydrogenase (NADP+)/methenyltetrahydrofolate cyclohydrolase